MAISESFREAANIYTGTLYADTTEPMEEKGYVFLAHSWTDNSPARPTENWETLVDKLGGENAINADFHRDQDPAFTVTHIATGKKAQGNGSVNVLAELWLAVH